MTHPSIQGLREAELVSLLKEALVVLEEPGPHDATQCPPCNEEGACFEATATGLAEEIRKVLRDDSVSDPSVRGLTEALFRSWFDASHHDVVYAWPGVTYAEAIIRLLLQAQAAYLTEHGVLLSGEGLVRAEEAAARCGHEMPGGRCARQAGHRGSHYPIADKRFFGSGLTRLAPVPQDGET